MKIFLFVLLLVSAIDIDKLDDDEYWDNLDVEEYEMAFDDDEEIEEGGAADPVAPVDEDAPEKPNTSMSAKIMNQWSAKVDIYFQVPGGPVKFFFTQDPGSHRDINTFTAHNVIAAVHKTKKVIQTFVMERKTLEYVVPANTDPKKLKKKSDLPLSSVPGATDATAAKDPNAQFPMQFINNYAKPVDLYWMGKDVKGVYVTGIEASSDVTVNTFKDHTFYVTNRGDDKTKLEIRQVTNTDIKELVFGSLSTPIKDGATQQQTEDDDLEDEADLDEVEVEEKKEPRRRTVKTVKEVPMEPKVSEWSTVIENPLAQAAGFVAKFINLQNYEVAVDVGGKTIAILSAGESTTKFVLNGAKIDFLKGGISVKKSAVSTDQIFYVLAGDNEEWNRIHKSDMKQAKKYYKQSRRFWYVESDKTRGKGFFWPASQVGQKNRLTNKKGFFTCEPNEADKDACFAKGTTRLKLKTISVKPRAIEVEQVLGEKEIAYLLSLGAGSYGQEHSKVLKQIYDRVAGLFRTKKLKADQAEDLTVVEYLTGSSQAPDADFDVKDCSNNAWATLLLPLEVAAEGGILSFPNGNYPFEYKPVAGNGVIYYNQLTDGNVDGQAAYEFSEVKKGNVKLAKLVLWNPEHACGDKRFTGLAEKDEL